MSFKSSDLTIKNKIFFTLYITATTATTITPYNIGLYLRELYNFRRG